MAAPVQKELGLTEKQKSQLKKLDTTMSQKRRQMFTRTRSRQGDTDPEKMRTSMDSLRREQEEAISKILEPKQKTRLGEIELQREGIFAVARTDVAKKLKLTSTQTDQIKTIVDQMRQDERAAMPRPPEGFQGPGGGPPGEMVSRVAALQVAALQAKVVSRVAALQVAALQVKAVSRVAALRARRFPGGGPPGEGGFRVAALQARVVSRVAALRVAAGRASATTNSVPSSTRCARSRRRSGPPRPSRSRRF